MFCSLVGQLYASHLGKSWGTRDGVFLVSLLEMLRNPKLGQLPKYVYRLLTFISVSIFLLSYNNVRSVHSHSQRERANEMNLGYGIS